jgi:hypothetical protein
MFIVLSRRDNILVESEVKQKRSSRRDEMLAEQPPTINSPTLRPYGTRIFYRFFSTNMSSLAGRNFRFSTKVLFALKGQHTPARRNAAGNGKHRQRPERAIDSIALSGR